MPVLLDNVDNLLCSFITFDIANSYSSGIPHMLHTLSGLQDSYAFPPSKLDTFAVGFSLDSMFSSFFIIPVFIY